MTGLQTAAQKSGLRLFDWKLHGVMPKNWCFLTQRIAHEQEFASLNIRSQKAERLDGALFLHLLISVDWNAANR